MICPLCERAGLERQMRRSQPAVFVKDEDGSRSHMDEFEVVADYFCDGDDAEKGRIHDATHLQAMFWVEVPNHAYPQGVWCLYREGKQVDKW